MEPGEPKPIEEAEQETRPEIFVGREEELNYLNSLITAPRRHDRYCPAYVLEAPSGFGKSALLNQLATQLSEPESEVYTIFLSDQMTDITSIIMSASSQVGANSTFSEAIETINASGKPIVLIDDRTDLASADQEHVVKQSIYGPIAANSSNTIIFSNPSNKKGKSLILNQQKVEYQQIPLFGLAKADTTSLTNELYPTLEQDKKRLIVELSGGAPLLIGQLGQLAESGVDVQGLASTAINFCVDIEENKYAEELIAASTLRNMHHIMDIKGLFSNLKLAENKPEVFYLDLVYRQTGLIEPEYKFGRQPLVDMKEGSVIRRQFHPTLRQIVQRSLHHGFVDRYMSLHMAAGAHFHSLRNKERESLDKATHIDPEVLKKDHMYLLNFYQGELDYHVSCLGIDPASITQDLEMESEQE